MNVVSRIRDALLALGAATVLWAGSAADAAAALTATPITWDVVGLDSNRPLTSGHVLLAAIQTDHGTVPRTLARLGLDRTALLAELRARL